MIREVLLIASSAYCVTEAATAPSLPLAAGYAAGAMALFLLSRLAG